MQKLRMNSQVWGFSNFVDGNSVDILKCKIPEEKTYMGWGRKNRSPLEIF